jgi:hypothetical protein
MFCSGSGDPELPSADIPISRVGRGLLTSTKQKRILLFDNFIASVSESIFKC